MDKDSSEQGKSTNNSLAKKNQSVSSLVQNSGIIESLQLLTHSNPLAVTPNNRKQRHTILSQNQDDTWDNQVGIKFSIERKVDGLPSIFLNNIQHSGTHFFATRFHALSYAKFAISSYPYLIPSNFPEFQEGGYFAQDHLHFNNYNAIRLLELLDTTKVVLHFRDPRSAILSMTHLMYRKNTPKQIHIESMRWGGEVIPLDFHEWAIEKRLDFLIENYYKTMCSDFVNNWLAFAKSISDDKKKNLLITEFKELKDSPTDLFSKIMNFLEIQKHVKKIPSTKDLPKGMWDKNAANSHFRKGLLDEWKEACNYQQLKYMNELISQDCYEFFNWAQ